MLHADKPYTDRDGKEDERARQAIKSNSKHTDIMKILDIDKAEDFKIDGTLYIKFSDCWRMVAGIELEVCRQWKSEKYPYHNVAVYKHKYDKYHNCRYLTGEQVDYLPTFMIRFSNDLSQVCIFSFDDVIENKHAKPSVCWNGGLVNGGMYGHVNYYVPREKVTFCDPIEWEAEIMRRIRGWK